MTVGRRRENLVDPDPAAANPCTCAPQVPSRQRVAVGRGEDDATAGDEHAMDLAPQLDCGEQPLTGVERWRGGGSVAHLRRTFAVFAMGATGASTAAATPAQLDAMWSTNVRTLGAR